MSNATQKSLVYTAKTILIEISHIVRISFIYIAISDKILQKVEIFAALYFIKGSLMTNFILTCYAKNINNIISCY